MRDYILNQAISQGEYGIVSFLRRVTRNWKAKRRIAALGNFDDYMLRDILSSQTKCNTKLRCCHGNQISTA